MARVTVEDCDEKVKDRFELVHIAAYRTKAIASGIPIMVKRDSDKNTVIALREIAQGHIDVDNIREALIKDNISGRIDPVHDNVEANADNVNNYEDIMDNVGQGGIVDELESFDDNEDMSINDDYS